MSVESVSTVVAMVRSKENNTADAAAPTLRCPYCRYDLTGLPGPHRCPECAFEYGAEAKSWESSYRGKDRVVKFVFWPWLLILFYITAIDVIVWLAQDRPKGELILGPRYLVFWTIASIPWIFIHASIHPILFMDESKVIFGGRRRRLRTVPLFDFWMPHPDERNVISPWSGFGCSSGERSPLRRVWDAAWNGKVFLNHPMHAFIRPPPHTTSIRATRLFGYPDFPRRVRRSVMLSIYDHWKYLSSKTASRLTENSTHETA